MQNRVIKFLDKHHVLTLVTQSSRGVYCANAFYAFSAEHKAFVFSTDVTTRHGAEMIANPQVAASVVLETDVVGKIQGAQITGRVVEASATDKMLYIKRFPYAIAIELHLWRLEIDELKLTDNTLGFGRKLIWSRE